MEVFRAVYVVPDETDYGLWVQSFWQEESPVQDPLYQLLKPVDLRGEAKAWGEWPHWTVLDALTTSEPEAFSDIVQNICRLWHPPVIIPERLNVLGTALAVQCACPSLDRIRAALVTSTRSLITRMPLADEEFQRGFWWIDRVGKDMAWNRTALESARHHYVSAGAPPIPSSRHFRLGFLVKLWKAVEAARKSLVHACAEDQQTVKEAVFRAETALDHFLTCGEPPWYAGSGGFHTTVASGFPIEQPGDSNRLSAEFDRKLWDAVATRLPAYQPRSLAIMGENPGHSVTVRFFDWLTETFVEETRPGFKVLEAAPFAPISQPQPEENPMIRRVLIISLDELEKHFTENIRQDIKIIAPEILTWELYELLRSKGKILKPEKKLDIAIDSWTHTQKNDHNWVCESADFGMAWPQENMGPLAVAFANEKAGQEEHHHKRHMELYYSHCPISGYYRDSWDVEPRTIHLPQGGAVVFGPGIIHKITLHGLTLVIEAPSVNDDRFTS